MRNALTRRPKLFIPLVAGLTLVFSSPVFGGDDFTIFLQTTGDWSGSYTGEDLGLSNDTVVLYQHLAGDLDERGPEYVDMESHLAALARGIDRYVPQGFSGLAILDYELYPLSLYNQTHTAIREPRIQAQLDAHPGIGRDEAERLAAEAYLPYARRFFLESLRTAKQLRPDAKWGYYSLVRADRNLPMDDRRKWVNDQSNWFWEEVDVICPYAYTGYHELDPEHVRVEELMVDKTREAVRIADGVLERTDHRPMVYPYMSARTVYWGLSQYEGQWATQSQLSNFFRAARQGGADGLILWQSVKDSDDRRRTESEYVQTLDTTVQQALREVRMGAFTSARDSGTLQRIATKASAKNATRIIERLKDEADARDVTLGQAHNTATRIIRRGLSDRSENLRKRIIRRARWLEERIKEKKKQSGGNSGF